MPFVAVLLVAYNVLRLPTPREPTVRAAKGCPPPLPEAVLTRLRWPAAEGRDAAKACYAMLKPPGGRASVLPKTRCPAEAKSGGVLSFTTLRHRLYANLQLVEVTLCPLQKR
jgi:hypothetical protein